MLIAVMLQALLPHACSIIRGINQAIARARTQHYVAADALRLQLCVVRRKEKDQKFPPAAITHRGGALPLQHLPFFTDGKKYRIPMFLATSFDINTAYGFWCAPLPPYSLPPPLAPRVRSSSPSPPLSP